MTINGFSKRNKDYFGALPRNIGLCNNDPKNESLSNIHACMIFTRALMLKMKSRVLITEGGARSSLHHLLTCRDKGRAFLVTFRSEDPHFVQCQPYRVLPYQRGLDDIAQSYKDQKASLDKVNLHMDSSKNADTKENGSPVPSNPLLEE